MKRDEYGAFVSSLIELKYCQTTSAARTQVLPEPVADLTQYFRNGTALASSAMLLKSASWPGANCS